MRYPVHFLALSLIILFNINSAYARSNAEIKLVLQITVDGLRGDLLNRYAGNFGKGGFSYLLNNGVVYSNAHYLHANTETIVGHTTLATGTFPSVHGMIGNVWFDSETKELAYNIEDPEHPIIPTTKSNSKVQHKGEQVDPAQKLSRTKGRSPKVILAPTIGDGMAAYFSGRSKIFGVSGKDRSAVSMAGKTGKAFWYSTDSGDMVTSTYYYKDYPEWVSQWNGQHKADSYQNAHWNLLYDKSKYQLSEQDDRPYEVDLKGYGRVFPHPFGAKDDKLFYTRLLLSPVGDELILDFAKRLLTEEQLGQDTIPDYLSVSFSGVDAVNHFFGPSSLENEDVVLQLDRSLADLLSYVDKQVGLKNTLIVLSADHGMADMPEYMTEMGYKVGRLDPDKIVETANQTAKQYYGIDEVVRFFYRPYLYLDEKKIAAAKLSKPEVGKTISESLSKMEGVAIAFSHSTDSGLNSHHVVKAIQNNFHPERSGDIYIAQDPYWFLFEKGPVAVMHGSPWKYDTHVPIIFAGLDIKSQQVNRLVHPVDVAPTITSVLGLTPPASSQGNPLKEVLD